MDAAINIIKGFWEFISGYLPSEGETYSTVAKFSWAIALLIVVGGGIFIVHRIGEAINGLLSSVPAKVVGFVVVVVVAILVFK